MTVRHKSTVHRVSSVIKVQILDSEYQFYVYKRLLYSYIG